MVVLKDKYIAPHVLNRDAIWAYSEKLQREGWEYSVSGGCCYSPDGSAMYVDNRSPYYGQIIQASPNGDAYEAIVEKLLATGDFVRK